MGKRVWVRHIETGDLGYKVEEDGKTLVVLDRPNEVIKKPYVERLWNIDKDRRPLNQAQLALIAHAADGHLCKALGSHTVNKGDWNMLSDQERIRWMEGGPSKGVRKRLYEAIMWALEPVGPGE